MSQSELPVGNPETFLGECEQMDLTALKDKLFMVAINSSSRENGKFICETAHGPYDFLEMVEEVATMWEDCQHHAKVYILSKDKNMPCQWLDTCTVDYVEAKHVDIVTDAFMAGAFDSKEFTCRAGIKSADDDVDPRKAAKEPTEESEE